MNGSLKSSNSFHNMLKSSKRSEFLRIYLYFCHVIQYFICFYCDTKTSKISDLAKQRVTSCDSNTYKISNYSVA